MRNWEEYWKNITDWVSKQGGEFEILKDGSLLVRHVFMANHRWSFTFDRYGRFRGGLSQDLKPTPHEVQTEDPYRGAPCV